MRTDSRAEPLSRDEDGELRLLTWFGMAGQVSEPSHDRVTELRSRDRRATVRDPRPDPLGTADEVAPVRFGIRGRAEPAPDGTYYINLT